MGKEGSFPDGQGPQPPGPDLSPLQAAASGSLLRFSS